jgi:hypothetical protein
VDTGGGVGTGNAGAVYAMGNGAAIWNAGTSFPASKATNDRYWRTDLGMEFYWDGTRWVSTTVYRESMNGISNSSSDVMPLPAAQTGDVLGYSPLWAPTYDIYVLGAYFWYYVLTTNNGSNFWTHTVDFDSANPISKATSADAANTNFGVYVALNAALTAPKNARFYTTKTGTPGSAYVAAVFNYRLIGT